MWHADKMDITIMGALLPFYTLIKARVYTFEMTWLMRHRLLLSNVDTRQEMFESTTFQM